MSTNCGSSLSVSILQWLVDHVYAIREAATTNLRKLVETFGVDWAKETVVPKILSLAQDQNYLRRMTTIFCVNELAPILSGENISKLILPTLIRLSNDNVRISYQRKIGESDFG